MCREYISNSSASLRTASLRITGQTGNPVIGTSSSLAAPVINPLCHGDRPTEGEDVYSSGDEFQAEPVVVSGPTMLFQQQSFPVRSDPQRPVNVGEYQMGVAPWIAGLKLTIR